MQSHSSDVPEPAVILLGRGMPPGEQQLALQLAADQLSQEGYGDAIRVAFLEITSPGLTDVLEELHAEGRKRAVIVPAFVPWDRNIRAWLPRFLAGWAPEHVPGLDVVVADSLDETREWYEGLRRNVEAARDRLPVTQTARPIFRRPNRSSVPVHRHQVLVCVGPRCSQAGAWQVMQEMRSAIADLGLNKVGEERVLLTRTGCQQPCNLSPLVTVQPDNVWYGNLTAEQAREVVHSHLANGKVLEQYSHRPNDPRQNDREVEPDFPSFEGRVGDIRIESLFVRPAMHLNRAAAAFMQITNEGSQDDELVLASTPLGTSAFVHGPDVDTPHDGKFAPLKIPAGTSVVMEPGELHMMLTGMQGEIIEGDAVPLDLEFKRSGQVHFDLVCHPSIQMG